MKRAALIAVCLVVAAGTARSQDRPQPEPPQPLACVPPARARELVFAQKLVPPFRIMRQSAVLSGSESIDIQLCWFRGGLVYDVTLLSRDGRLVHRLIAAPTGEPLGDHPKP